MGCCWFSCSNCSCDCCCRCRYLFPFGIVATSAVVCFCAGFLWGCTDSVKLKQQAVSAASSWAASTKHASNTPFACVPKRCCCPYLAKKRASPRLPNFWGLKPLLTLTWPLPPTLRCTVDQTFCDMRLVSDRSTIAALLQLMQLLIHLDANTRPSNRLSWQKRCKKCGCDKARSTESLDLHCKAPVNSPQCKLHVERLNIT